MSGTPLTPVAIDSGKFNTKGIAKDSKGNPVRICFRTKMDPSKETSAKGNDSYVVSINGNSYLIGKQAEGVDFDKDKQKDIHRVSIYAAIAQLVSNGSIVNLAVGCPMDLFANKKKRDEFGRYVQGLSESNDLTEIRLTLDEVEHHFTIGQITVMPESAGVIFKNWNALKDKLVGVIDIGGLNVNACVYDRGDPIQSTVFTINKGANIFMNELKGELNQEFNSNFQDWGMEAVLRDGFIKKDPEASKILIKEFMKNYVDEIVKIAKQNNWDVDNMDLIFTGGGSLLLGDYIILTQKDATISKNAIWDNVEGFGEYIGL